MEHLVERDEACDGDESGTRRDLPARWSDAELVAAMQRGQPGSFSEFFARFAPLITALARARRLPNAELTERVTDFLDDVALRLARAATPVPRTLAAYLAASFRRRDFNRIRDLRCRERLRDAYSTDANDASERVVAGASSENALTASRGPGWDGAPLSPAVERLALVLEQRLTGEERQLLAWLGARVPQREIATWLGATHGATRTRIARLRARLRDAAMRHAYTLDGADRAAITRFFRRVDIEVPTVGVPAAPNASARTESSPEGEEYDP